MPMTNLDQLQENRNAILQRMTEAARDNDTEAFTAAFNDLANDIAETVRADFNAIQGANDAAVLASRGVRVLTSTERDFWQRFIDAARSNNPRQAFDNIDVTFPETVFDQIFEDLKENHPLLNAINFRNTERLTKWLTSNTSGNAGWGKLGAKVADELSAEFTEVKLDMAQLTAYVPMPRYLLDLGPSWIDRYVREMLAEAIAVALEKGIVSGTGKDQPCGMIMKLTGAMDGVHTAKETTSVTSLDPVTYGSLLDTLTKTPNGHRRAVNRVVLIVNPSDYFTKVFPATTVRAADGTYNTNVFPFPTTVIQSAAVEVGKAVLGLPERYFMGIGAGTNGGKLEYSDQYKFLERERTYLTYLYGYGQAMDENAFIYLDISGLVPTNLQVEITNKVEVTGTVKTEASEAV